MIILIKLIFIHLVIDYLLQPEKWIKEKKTQKAKSKFLYIHGLLQGLFSWIAVSDLSAWWIIILIATTHILIDLWKIKQKETTRNYVIDQTLHLFFITFTWLIYTQKIDYINNSYISRILNDSNLWIIACSTILLFRPSGIFIGLFTSKWPINTESLNNAGKYIGYFERILIFIFILSGFYEAIGFLIAAKSILRIGGQKTNDRKETEYVLVGTFLSFTIAILIGLLAKYMLHLQMV